MANGNKGKRYNVTGTRHNETTGNRDEVTVIPIGARREAIATIDRNSGNVFMPTAEDRAAANAREATFVPDDTLAEMDAECPFK